MTDYIFQADLKNFKPDITKYDINNAFFLSDCAKLAYEDEDVVKPIMTKDLGFEKFDFFDQGDTQGYIVGNDKIIIIAFRGTQEPKDFVVDADAIIEDGAAAGKVHKGFQNALHHVWGDESSKDMRQFIKQIRDNDQTVWFCGHSLGAALASLAASEYQLNDNMGNIKAINGVYTIGQPRVGNNVFAKAFDSELGEKCFRIVNNNDIVTRVPSPGLIRRYTHVGQEIYIDSNGKVVGAVSFWNKLSDRLSGYQKAFGKIGVDAFSDHSSVKYVEHIKNNI